jgi:hypothetical protein
VHRHADNDEVEGNDDSHAEDVQAEQVFVIVA